MGRAIASLLPPRLGRLIHFSATVALLAIRRFFADRCLIGASALSYTTLVSMVPLTAVALVTFSGFPIFANVRQRLLDSAIENFAPSVGKEAANWFAFAANNAAQTTALGLISLIATAILLLATIEDQMHVIFRVTVPRSWGQRVLVYWTVLTLGPLLLGVGLSISGELDGVMNLFREYTVAAEVPGRIIPFLFETTALLLLYWAMPQCRVPLPSALTGAVICALALQLLKLGFGTFIAQFSTYSRVYGALAGVPIFLLWMYIFWTAVLLGAEVTSVLARRVRAPEGG